MSKLKASTLRLGHLALTKFITKRSWKATWSFLAGRVSSLETWLTKVPSLGTCLKIQLTVTAKDWIELSNWVTFLLDDCPEEATILLESIDCPLTLSVWLFHEVSTLRPCSILASGGALYWKNWRILTGVFWSGPCWQFGRFGCLAEDLQNLGKKDWFPPASLPSLNSLLLIEKEGDHRLYLATRVKKCPIGKVLGYLSVGP